MVMEKDIRKDLNRIKAIAVLHAIEHNCKYNIIIFNHVHGNFDEDRSTYEIVRDSYFEKDRPHVLIIHNTDDLLENREQHFDSTYLKIIRDKEAAMGRIKALSDVVVIDDAKHLQSNTLPYTNQYEKEVRSSKKAEQVIKTEPETNRNDPCPCGSGLKFKRCCLNKK